MSGQQNSDNNETLFSLELLVECVRIEKEGTVSDELALGVRLLDFPTLLVYQPQQSSDDINRRGRCQRGEHAFNRGKCCFFKMNLNSLHNQLLNSPLYAMVLDVKEDIPKLVGTSLISLAKVMDRIRLDVTEHGASTPSSHGERGLVGVCNLKGEKIGSISLSYKLLSLGASLLPHITDNVGDKSSRVHGKQEESVMEKNISTELLNLECGSVCSPTPDISNNKSNEKNLINEDKQDRGVCIAMQTEHKPKSQIPQTLKETENSFEEALTTFCPPHLFYSNSSEEKSKEERGDCRLLHLDSAAFTFEDTYSEEEPSDNKIEDPSSLIMNQRVRYDVKMSRNQQESGTTPNVLGEALQRLPLLNALLVELAQLNDQNPQRPLSIHPNLAWIYRPASTEPSDEHGNTARKAQTKSLQKTRQWASPPLKNLHTPRNCSTPVVRAASVKVKDKQEQALFESKSSSTSPKKKLVYGTTKTFNLRLKQISPLRVKRRECVELIKNETQSSMAKGRTRSSNKIIKSGKGKSALKQRTSLNESIETMIQSITVNSALQETITRKQKNLHEKVGKQDRNSPEHSHEPSLSERGLKVIHLPSVDVDSVAKNKDKNKHHSESNQSLSESDRHGDNIESSRSSRHSSPKSSFSDSSGGGNEEADYADDFNSLEPSDAYSPDPASSPESSRAKAPRSPLRPDLCNSDSGSEGFQSRAVLPVPIKTPHSPQRALRGTHIIRPRTHTSALSFSSDDGDRDRSSSSQTSRKKIGRVERSSGADSFLSSRGQNSESTKNSDPVRRFSAESISSFEPQEAEELGDELGTLDFRNEYQHISKLVANKLPGYTM